MDPSPDLVIPRLASRAASRSLTPRNESEITSLCLVIVSSLSILGAGFMLLSFLCLPNLRSFRHRLIFGLAVVDLLRASNTLISASMDLAHRELDAPRQSVFCAVNGFANEVFVVQQDYWVLLIAICTFILLTGSPIAGAWIQSHQIFLMPLPWLMSVIWAWLGLQVSGGYQSIGSLCWFADDKARLFVNFVPRWIIILTILILYLRIYFVLSRSARVAARQPENACTSSCRNLKPARHSFHRGHRQSTTGNAKLKKTARMMIQYPIVYAAIWVIPTGARIYHAATGRDVPFALHTVDLCCVVLTGFVNAITYGVNEAALSSWRTFVSRRPYHPPDPANRPSSFLLRPRGSESSAIRSAANPNRLTVDSHAGFGGGGGVLDGSTHRPRPVSEDRQTVQLPEPEPAYPTVSPIRPAVRITDIAPWPESHTRPWA
ncbi:hypothetical protein MAPG_08256 [Magnaporthiopsis poae ATCC 64411]|uniref:G-protein coupled receptors family 2 profile 2 domain-containing protein n=1 Tax=Magnaporthiopsis poae (strain ATCC 64411 / 73-15) TaxID=644358 RepID=A0A0C4E6V9_MAGP6|nr:hypothetical protein MAPG_08256 [Magnaporthiopsis poae ATCC 64411]